MFQEDQQLTSNTLGFLGFFPSASAVVANKVDAEIADTITFALLTKESVFLCFKLSGTELDVKELVDLVAFQAVITATTKTKKKTPDTIIFFNKILIKQFNNYCAKCSTVEVEHFFLSQMVF